MDVATFLRLPPVMAAQAAVAQTVMTRSGRRTKATTAIGGAIAAAGLGVAYLGSHVFTEAETTVDPTRPEDASVLVTHGVFAYTRNPMYLGMALVLLGHAVHRRQLRALLPLGAFVGIIDGWQIAREEEALRVRFGEEYDQYADEVRRWV